MLLIEGWSPSELKLSLLKICIQYLTKQRILTPFKPPRALKSKKIWRGVTAMARCRTRCQRRTSSRRIVRRLRWRSGHHFDKSRNMCPVHLSMCFQSFCSAVRSKRARLKPKAWSHEAVNTQTIHRCCNRGKKITIVVAGPAWRVVKE